MTLPFDDSTVASVATAVGVAQQDLADAARAVQSAVDDYPGVSVDGLVYEWRQAFAADPLVEQTPTAWVLRVPERVWSDVTNRAGVRDGLRPALRALHATETPEDLDEAEGENGEAERVTLVLSRV